MKVTDEQIQHVLLIDYEEYERQDVLGEIERRFPGKTYNIERDVYKHARTFKREMRVVVFLTESKGSK